MENRLFRCSKIMAKPLILSVLIILLFVPSVNAEPTNTIKYLMNEPVSMLDWGIKCLNENLKVNPYSSHPLQINKIFPDARAFYNWDLNRITITLTYFDPDNSIPDMEEDKLKKIVKEKTNIFKLRVKNLLLNCFTHSGYQSQNHPVNLTEEIQKVVSIESSVTLLKTKRNSLRGKSPLMSSEIFWSSD